MKRLPSASFLRPVREEATEVPAGTTEATGGIAEAEATETAGAEAEGPVTGPVAAIAEAAEVATASGKLHKRLL